MSQLRIQCFGELEVRYGDQRLAGFESQKVRALLVYLACHLNRSLSRDHLAAFLWPEKNEETARRNLRQALYNTRSLFPDGVELLEGSRQELRLNAKLDCWVDVLAFEEVLDESETFERADPRLLTEAAGLYRGDFLSGFYVKGSSDFDFWMLSEQERLRERAMIALRQLIDSYLSRGAFRLGIQYAQKLVALDPMSEDAHRKLMEIYALAGRRGRALGQYEELETMLSGELGVRPLEETRELRRKIISDEVAFTVADVREEGIGPLIPLVGRREEYKRLRECLTDAREGRALLTMIEGETGVGKSRLMKSFLDSVSSSDSVQVLKGRCFDEVPAVLEPFSRVIQNALTADSTLIRAVVEDSEDLSEVLSRLNPTAAGKGKRPRSGSIRRARKEIFDAVAEFLSRLCSEADDEQDDRFLILMLDDFEFADPAAADLLRHLQTRLRGRRAWILIAYNPESADESRSVQKLRNEIRKQDSKHHLLLQPLDANCFDEITSALVGIQRAPELAAFLTRKASGLPLAIVEWINFLWDEGMLVSELGRWQLAEGLDDIDPEVENVDQLVQYRVLRLPNSTKRVACLAALAGPAFEVELVTTAGDEHTAVVDIGLELLLERWMIRRFTDQWQDGRRERDLVLWSQGAKRGQFEFSSKLIRKTLRAQIGKRRRRVMHASIAAAIEILHGQETADLSELLAYHHREAGNHEKAWEHLILAGDKARAVAAVQTARGYYEAASESLRSLVKSIPEKQVRWNRELSRLQARQSALQ